MGDKVKREYEDLTIY